MIPDSEFLIANRLPVLHQRKTSDPGNQNAQFIGDMLKIYWFRAPHINKST
jgi:hypothetical protein